MQPIYENKKLDVITQALIHKGICLNKGIAEHIVEELKLNGYKIKKKKK